MPRQITISEGDDGKPPAFNGRIDALVAENGKSYVTLSVKDPQLARTQEEGTPLETVTAASGFAIDNDGHILTAAHVAVAQGWLVEAKGPNGRKYRGRVVATLPGMDTALIQLDRAGGLAPVRPVANPCLTRGEAIYSLGRPRSSDDLARLGTVASLSFGQPVSYQGYGYSDAMVLRLQTRPGESGGPVFNARGELVGMLVSTLSDGSGRPLNLAHAVTMPRLSQFICGKIKCPAGWQALVGKSVKQCPEDDKKPS